MNHLPVGAWVTRANVFTNHGVVEYSTEKVRVVLQHESLGTFFDTGKRFMSAWHGELHDSEESAIDFIIDRLAAGSYPRERVDFLVNELVQKKISLQKQLAVA